jgi:hypothetical protein
MGELANFYIMSGGQAIDSLRRKILLQMQKRDGFLGRGALYLDAKRFAIGQN